MSSPFVRWLIPLGCIPPLSEWRVKVLYLEMLQTRMWSYPGSFRCIICCMQAGVGGDSSSFTTATTLNRGKGVYPEHQSPWTTRTAAKIAPDVFFFCEFFQFLEEEHLHLHPIPPKRVDFKVSGKSVCWMLLCLHRKLGKKDILKSVLT